mgnify:CR=1 FL=1
MDHHTDPFERMLDRSEARVQVLEEALRRIRDESSVHSWQHDIAKEALGDTHKEVSDGTD